MCENDRIPKMITLFSIIIWLSTEGLSILNALTPANIRLLWAVIGAVILAVLWMKRNKWKTAGRSFGDMRSHECFLLGMCLTLIITMFILAVTIVPNNWDSMTYHLPRVANWIQNASVRYYPTNIPRQLYYSAFTEYYILHICLFFKNDQFVNLVQWFGYAASAYMVYLIALKLQIKRAGCIFAAFLFIMCSTAIAESVTTQTDLMATMWILIFAYFVLKVGENTEPLSGWGRTADILYCAASIGLGFLTKSSICFMMLPFLIWLLAVCIKRKEKPGAMLKCAIMALAVIITLALPSFIRNYHSTGNILAFEQMARKLMVKTLDPRLLLLNACKNLSLEAAGDIQPDFIWSATMKLAGWMGIDIENPEISAYEGFSDGVDKAYHHDGANPQMLFMVSGIMAIASVIVLLYCFRKHQKIKNCREVSYVCTGLCAALLMFICIRWQPWGMRLFLPALPFLCFFISYITVKLFSYKSMGAVLSCGMGVIIAMMCLDAGACVRFQIEEYAIPKWQGKERFGLYFSNNRLAEEAYKEIIRVEKEQIGASDIGMLLDNDSYEYPLWVGLKDEEVTLHHVVLDDDIVSQPECILAIGRGIYQGDCIQYGNIEYECTWHYGDEGEYAIMLPEDD